ncbi:MAG TPA: nitrite/sulfite reductase [Vicinamibacteria bacterium]|nr:nitrite/sulfite reductase [Vicinamibacteria bacterium]
MHARSETSTLGRSRLSFADEAEIDEFVRVLEAYERGELGPDEWRAFRLVRGTYGQRQTGDFQMLRVKIPQGVLDARQLEALADVAERWSRGFAHVTTRQNFQFHFMSLHDVEKALRRLAEVGLTSREACGNSVRNVTACPYAGVARDELFDVTPYAEALTRHLLRRPIASTLPRKFKIAFEGCAEDHAGTAINDIGWRARFRREGGKVKRGFRVTAGGGTSILPSSGRVLFEFLPAREMLDVAEAIVRTFQRLGDYQHKQRNRMKFLIASLGWDNWKAEVERDLAEVRAAGGAPLPFDPEDPPVEEAPTPRRSTAPAPGVIAERASAALLRGPGLRPETRTVLQVLDHDRHRWARTNVRPQRQQGYSTVTVSLPLGDLTAVQLRLLGELSLAYGDGTLRTAVDQDLVFRWIRTADVPALYERLAAAGLQRGNAGTIANVTSCPGAESCRLAVTQSRGLGKLLSEHLAQHPDRVAAAGDLDIKISGCPNGCGQHHIAGLGFQGSVRRVAGRAAPQYFVMVGGGIHDDGARFGRLAAKIPARRLPEALDRLIDLFVAQRAEGESARAYFQRVDLAHVKGALAGLEALPPEQATPHDFVDLGEQGEFKLETMEGECSA